MSGQPNAPQEPPKPNQATIILVQRRELERLNDNRVYLMSIIEDIKAEAGAEIQRLADECARLEGVIDQLKGMISEDVIEEAEAIISGKIKDDG